MGSKAKHRIKIVLFSFLIFFVAIFMGFYIYTLDYYHADDTALQILDDYHTRITIKDNMTFLYPSKENDLSTAFIFYPGGKVEADAYLPLLSSLSDKGITCILVKMPFHLAVFNIRGADKVLPYLADFDHYYIGGHSLGGAMASSYVKSHQEQFEGLILLGAYPVNEINLPTLALYGSNDLVLDKTKLIDTIDLNEIVGGNHAYFGNYGEQDGDGTAAITREQQQDITMDNIINFINQNN